MTDLRKIFGNESENLAAIYLKQLGLEIIARQYKTKIGEIDLIARDGGEIVFIEVKARKSNQFGYPEESVTAHKLEKIALVAEQYLKEKRLENRPYRIDVVAIESYNNDNKITHYKSVN